MSSEWKEVSLDQICFIIKRGICPKYSEKEGILVINQKCIRNQKLSIEEARKHDIKLKVISQEKYLQVGDVLINSTGMGTLGRVAQVKKINEPTTVDSHVTIVRPNPKHVNLDYFGWAIRAQESFIESLGEGSTGQTELSRILVGKIQLSLPSLEDQISIGKILNSLDDKIELNLQMCKTLEDIASTLFKSWFIDFDPVKAKAAGQEPEGLSPEIAALFPDSFVDSPLGKIPKGWKYCTIGSKLTTILGGTPSRLKPEYWTNGSVPWINSGKTNEFRIIKPTEWITQEALLKSATKLLPARTTVLAITGATLGQVSITEIECCANQSVVGILANDLIPTEFIYLWVKKNIDKLISAQTGGAQQHINKGNVNELALVCPNHQILNVYRNQASPIFDKISMTCFQSENLVTLRNLLLPKLINGEIEIQDAEILLSSIT